MATQPRIESTPLAAQRIHQDTTVKWFLLGAVGYFCYRRHHRADHCGQICLAGIPRHDLVLHLRAHAPLACQRNALRLASGGGYGPRFFLVPRLCGVKLWSEKLGVATGDLVERHHPQRYCYTSGRLSERLGIRRSAHLDLVPGGCCLGDVRLQYLRHHRHAQVPADVRFDLVPDGHHPVDGLCLPDRQLRHFVCDRRQPGQPELDVHAQCGGTDLHAGWAWPSPTTSFRGLPTHRFTATSCR